MCLGPYRYRSEWLAGERDYLVGNAWNNSCDSHGCMLQIGYGEASRVYKVNCKGQVVCSVTINTINLFALPDNLILYPIGHKSYAVHVASNLILVVYGMDKSLK